MTHFLKCSIGHHHMPSAQNVATSNYERLFGTVFNDKQGTLHLVYWREYKDDLKSIILISKLIIQFLETHLITT